MVRNRSRGADAVLTKMVLENPSINTALGMVAIEGNKKSFINAGKILKMYKNCDLIQGMSCDK